MGALVPGPVYLRIPESGIEFKFSSGSCLHCKHCLYPCNRRCCRVYVYGPTSQERELIIVSKVRGLLPPSKTGLLPDLSVIKINRIVRTA